MVPRFRALADGDVEEKAPGELVTVADRDCERILSQALPYIVDAPVIGEERATADPASMELLASDGAAWLVDPIDGTAGFVEGSPEYAVMVAHVDRGRTVASWIYQPEFDRMAIASRGAGATVDGRTARASRPPSERAAWQGVIKDRFLPSVT